jgi:glycosyltransferase involved in cell wall biosynthesis
VSDPLVSVVVDNYNYERFLAQAIDSALAQTYSPVEVIVVDDGSTDRSREVIAGYGNRITAVLKENGGQASAFNEGFSRSVGDVVIFLDADDLLAPTAAAAAVAKFASSKVVGVHWPLWEIDAEGRHLGIWPPCEVAEGDLREITIAHGPWSHCSGTGASGSAWSRAFLETIMPVPLDLRFADAYPMILAPLAGRLGAVTQPQAYYRYHGQNRFGGRRTLDERLDRWRVSYSQAYAVMSAYLSQRGIAHDPDDWRGHDSPWYRFSYLEAGQQAIRRLVGPGEHFILLDQDEWRDHWCRGGIVEGRHPLPFLERDGEYAGHPGDDEEAIRELERMREDGARLLFVGASAFWWFDFYPGFGVHLRTTYRLAHLAEHLIAFDLSTPSKLAAGSTATRAPAGVDGR